MEQKKSYCRVLTIAGSDSGGGAGIQADLKTISANGCYAMSVITALTAQNTLGVSGIHPVPVDFVAAQMEAVLTDIGVDAVKIGMLYSPELIRVVAEYLQKFGVTRLVLDPVMIAQSGDKLLQDEAVTALKELLIPLATVITPNLPEAEVLLGRKLRFAAELETVCRELHSLGCSNVLLKGGHMDEWAAAQGDGAGGQEVILLAQESRDWLYLGATDQVVTLPVRRVQTNNNHGTGCTLSAAIASGLAKGLDVTAAVRQAKDYITSALQAAMAYRLGAGHGPVHHFFRFFP